MMQDLYQQRMEAPCARLGAIAERANINVNLKMDSELVNWAADKLEMLSVMLRSVGVSEEMIKGVMKL